MGLFRSEGERFGMLDAQAWRAARLVVDTGMHALRWPRQQSIDLLKRIGLSETDAQQVMAGALRGIGSSLR